MYFMSAFDDRHLIGAIALSDEAAKLQEAYDCFERGENDAGHYLLRGLVEDGHALALLLSSSFSKGDEDEEAFCNRHVSELHLAADFGERLALYSLGVYYDTGAYLEKDKEAALSCFRSAAEKGMLQAMHVYGVMLFYGTGGAVHDSPAGLEMIRMAADSGVAEAKDFLNFLERP